MLLEKNINIKNSVINYINYITVQLVWSRLKYD